MKITSITSAQNAHIKLINKLKDRNKREKLQLFLIEGYREIKKALDQSWQIRELVFCEERFLGKNEKELLKIAASQGVDLFHTTEPLFDKLSYRDRPDGLLAVAVQKHRGIEDLDRLACSAQHPLFFLLAEGIEKPGNLGSILRSCDAAGVDALILSDPCTDLFNPNTVRSSIGTLFSVPVFEGDKKSLQDLFERYRISIVATTPASSSCYTQIDLTGSVVICMGCEQLGLSDFWIQQAKIRASIPMLGAADSLNVATASTLMLYEVVRQRK